MRANHLSKKHRYAIILGEQQGFVLYKGMEHIQLRPDRPIEKFLGFFRLPRNQFDQHYATQI